MIDHCEWNAPGRDPYQGSNIEAIERYRGQIPEHARAELIAKMEARQYDETAVITRDFIGGGRFEPQIEFMHFGMGKVCKTVDRSAWLITDQEYGLVYCSGEHCVIVPTVCRNVSIVRRAKPNEPAIIAALVPPAEEPTTEKPLLPPLTAISTTSFEEEAFSVGHTPAIVAGPVYAGGPTLPYRGTITPPLPPVSPIPEPSTWATLLAGLAALIGFHKRSKR
jgi:hypothetical protein